jgi:predicted anti-sigma-YlaC factor YlaD
VICNSFEDLLEQYFENTLLPREAAAMKLHLDRCAACAALFEEVRVVDALLLTPHRDEPAPNFTFAVMAEVRSQRLPVRRKPPIAAFAAAYLAVSWLAIGMAFVFAHPLVTGTLGSAFAAVGHFAALLEAVARAPFGAFANTSAVAGGVLAFDIALGGIVLFVAARGRAGRGREARS